MKLWEKANFVAKYLITQCAIKKAMILNDNVKADLTLRASDHLQSIVQIWPKICTVRNFNSFPVQLRPIFFWLKGKSWLFIFSLKFSPPMKRFSSRNTNSPFRWFWILTVRVYPMFFLGNWIFQNSWL